MFPQDILVEILLKLDLKNLTRCVCVCKFWASIIRSQNFINSYESRSSIHESRVLLVLCDPMITQRLKPQCVNGLIYYECMDQLLICNPISRKITPFIQTNPNKLIWASYLGYDPINFQYKVLSFSKNNYINPPYIVYQLEVFTLGDEGSWKMIKDKNVEIPLSNGICINGILYYSALTMYGEKLLRFDTKTEEFGDFIEIPVEVVNMYGSYYTLMNYQGKLALLARQGVSFREYDLWILKDVEKAEWSRISIYITWELCPFNIIGLAVVGFVAGTGEVIITARDFNGHLHVIYVDLQNNYSREAEIQGVRCSNTSVFAFADYNETLMFL